ncbi:hypothetical protein V6N12_031987 [Hibiscus sabdariffa]|uniref:Uncharacterized protein n=1 Tax=Hibiscus sabdariffa TaxID=183260 RepID=A0ABR2BYQ6_9ROSI
MFWCIGYWYTRKRICTSSSETSRGSFGTKRIGTNVMGTGFMPGLINLGRLKKQQILVERSCADAALTKDPETIQAGK